MTNHKLKNAFKISYDKEISQIEERMVTANNADGPFSPAFEEKMAKMIQQEKSEPAPISRETTRIKPRRIFLIAAIIAIILAMAATAIGVTRPQIFYDIKEKLTHWDIMFVQDSKEAITPGFDYIRPDVPKGYHITEEVIGGNNYFIEFRNESDESIRYEQMRPDAANLSIYNEGGKISHQNINGHDAVITQWDDDTMIVIEDGEYVFELEGNCDYNTLIDIAKNIISRSE